MRTSCNSQNPFQYDGFVLPPGERTRMQIYRLKADADGLEFRHLTDFQGQGQAAVNSGRRAASHQRCPMITIFERLQLVAESYQSVYFQI